TTYEIGAHCIARPQRQGVVDVGSPTGVLRHAGGVLRQSFRIDHAVEVGRRRDGDQNCVAVARYVDI
ncbi:hypothetical protein CEXT_564931, partial [Caerostris extrusa]